MHKRLRIEVSGIVQGVGFRPFVYRLANRLQLTGFVNNNSTGVLIEIQGMEEMLWQFLHTLQHAPPPLAEITRVETQFVHPEKSSRFNIIPSQSSEIRRTLISPDIATCPDCISDISDLQNRWYAYPFTNCTNCGPRYTIITDIPYDRPNTSMSPFKMCPACQAEYEDPDNRRFHAQPNACAVCGPALTFTYNDGSIVEDDPVSAFQKAISNGQIVAVKGIGGFHLCVDARNNQAVSELRRRKHRFEKPLAVMVRDRETADKIAVIDESVSRQLNGLQRPIVLCKKKPDQGLSVEIAPHNDELGIMLPYTPLHTILFNTDRFDVLVMTSANISEEPICFENNDCLDRMSGIADAWLLHNRDIYVRCDDSVIRVHAQKPFFIRRSRGYAPKPVVLGKVAKSILAVGGQLKNTICITRKNMAFPSQHIGDLENFQTLQAFEHTIRHLQRILDVQTEAVVCDSHPDYLSTRWVEANQTVPYAAVQHHYAHILSVMAEYALETDVLGIALDGTGYGNDGTLWGGEILRCNLNSFQRLAALDPVAMPGGEKAVHEPWRMATAYLFNYGDENNAGLIKSLFPAKENEVNLVCQMIEKQVNSPLTSGCGRLFDAVAAILGIRESVTYEGQAAVMLENEALKYQGRLPDIGRFALNEIPGNDCLRIDPGQIVNRLSRLRLDNQPVSALSAAFHHQLVQILFETVNLLSQRTGIKQIVLSGGCFQNMILLNGLQLNLDRAGLKVYTNGFVPVNDGGISLGQAYWGMHNL